MSTPPASHDENRGKICLICFNKPASISEITDVTLERVKKHFLPEYNPSDEKFPTGICNHYRLLLVKIDKNEKCK